MSATTSHAKKVHPAPIRHAVLTLILRGRPLQAVADKQNLNIATVRSIATDAGWPDLVAVAAAIDDRPTATPDADVAAVPAPRQPGVSAPLTPNEAAAVTLALRLSTAARELDPDLIASLLRGLDRQGLIEVVIAATAMLAPTTQPDKALAWLTQDPATWTPATLRTERARHTTGARDATALAAEYEHHRRNG